MLTDKAVNIEQAKVDLTELDEIAKKLKLTENEKKQFVDRVFCLKDESSTEIENKLKIIYFTLLAEIEKLEKVKNRIEARCNFRIRSLLILFFILLTGQTIWFYHMIFNVDYLGWDIIEPTTFLLGSSIFVLGLFTYVKLNRSMLSSEHIVRSFKEKFYLKMYAKENFNIDRYMLLHSQAKEIRDSIENLEKL